MNSVVNRVILTSGLLLAISTIQVEAQSKSPKNDSLFYYQIGGGRHSSIPPQLTITTINLSALASASALNCGAFDPVASIEHSLNQVKDGADKAIIALEGAASAAIANLPGYILQKANPGLYDLFQNALLRAQESFSLATKSCERMEYEISEGINPYAEWVTLSRGDSWKRSVGVGQKNIHQAAKAASTATNSGLVWVGGVKRGGSSQPPINILSDVANAGLNILSNRSPQTAANLSSSAPLAQHFSGPSEVRGWIVEVLGEVQVSVCDGCTNGATSGKGLIPKIEAEAEMVLAQLTRLVAGDVQPTLDNLEAVSAPAIIVTLQLINAIQNQEATERGILLSKLAQEIAEARIMEQAMIIRRLMLSGIKEGNVAAIQMAVEEVDRALAELDDEINNVIFEKNVRNQFVADTAVQILLKDNATRTSSLNTPRLRPRDDRSLERGAINR